MTQKNSCHCIGSFFCMLHRIRQGRLNRIVTKSSCDCRFTVKLGQFLLIENLAVPGLTGWHLSSYQNAAMENSKNISTESGANAGKPSTPTQNFKPAVRVWLVDDNDELRTMVADLLTRYGGIECSRHFSSPDELLSTLASKPGPDVILLDVQMGERSGIDAVRPIKSLTRSTRVLMFTTANNRDWRERAFGEGASDYLLKSEAVERVIERIRTPAEDPASGFAVRRRPNCPPVRSLQSSQTASITERSPRLLHRALKKLRILAN